MKNIKKWFKIFPQSRWIQKISFFFEVSDKLAFIERFCTLWECDMNVLISRHVKVGKELQIPDILSPNNTPPKSLTISTYTNPPYTIPTYTTHLTPPLLKLPHLYHHQQNPQPHSTHYLTLHLNLQELASITPSYTSTHSTHHPLPHITPATNPHYTAPALPELTKPSVHWCRGS